jgi:predicted RNA methylase
MNSKLVPSAAVAAAPLATPSTAAPSIGPALVAAAGLLLADIERGVRIDASILRTAMNLAFGASDSEGAWDWKTAYDACEAAQILFLRKFGPAMHARAGSATVLLAMLAKVASLLPTHTRRSEESQALQQFSTPIGLGFVASIAAAVTPSDLVLEPSAGTGLMAILAEIAGASLVLNELADARGELLERLFAGVAVTRHDAAHIHDHLDAAVRPTVVLMNPPFSAAARVDGRVADAALRHLSSALARLAEGGRLVAITGGRICPDNPSWRDAFIRLQEHGRVVFTAAVDGGVYACHGTTTETRLTVIDRIPAEDPTRFPASQALATNLGMLLGLVSRLVPPRPIVTPPPSSAATPTAMRAAVPRPQRSAATGRTVAAPAIGGVELAYEPIDWTPGRGGRITDALYEGYRLQSIHIPGATAHPSRLVQSAAMASVAPPRPSYRPRLPAAVVADGLLSDAQLESVIYSGKVGGCSLQAFENATGLRLTDGDGSLREDLPPITTFLNRLLALTIDLQNTLFGVFEDLLRARVEGAIASGVYDLGVETVTAESLRVVDRRPVYRHKATGAETQVFTIARRERNRPFTLAEALARADDAHAVLLVNGQSGRAAVQVPAPSLMLDDGEVERRVRLLRPMERTAIPLTAMAQTHWREAERTEFAQAWEDELAELPAFSDSRLHIVTGLLLPIWKRLPDESMRVYRLQTDDGERIIGRLVSPAWVAESTQGDRRRSARPTPGPPYSTAGPSCTSKMGSSFVARRSWARSGSSSPGSPKRWSTG